MYDIANRLSSAGGVSYTWSNNGNLLSDGVATYTYNHTDRLASATQGPSTYTFAYNGLGDRLRQAVNGTPTSYTLDLAAGLTQVLSDGTNAYLYGDSRLGEEQPGGWQYYLGDALGSVRQLADASVNVMLTRSYEPFGDPLSSAGAGTTIYNFTGEQRDATGLIYLRARYYGSAFGRFLSRDIWEGDPNQPMSYNGWLYATASPVNHSDPSGHWFCEGATNCETWIGTALDRLRGVNPEGSELIDAFERFDARLQRRQAAILSLIPIPAVREAVRRAGCDSLGFPFVVTPYRPFGYGMQTMPWAIYIWEGNLRASPPEVRYALLGHEIHHLVRQEVMLAISIEGEMRAAQLEAALDRGMGVDDLPDWLTLDDGRDVTALDPGSPGDIELWRHEGGYHWWQPPRPPRIGGGPRIPTLSP